VLDCTVPPKIFLTLRCRRICVALLAGVFALSGCSESSQTGPTISDSTFVAVMAELVKLKNPETGDTAYFAEQRRKAMERHKVTLQDLEKKGERLAEDPARATKIWDRVRQKVGTGG
jgi:hypothetical protein